MPSSFEKLVTLLPGQTLLDLANFGPELALCGTIVAMLLLRVIFGRKEAPVLATLAIGAGAAGAYWFLWGVPEGRATVALWTFVIGVAAVLVLRVISLVSSFALGTRGGALSSSSNVVLMLGLAIGLALAIHDTWSGCCGGEPLARTELFGKLLVYDGLTTYFRTFLLAFTVLFTLVTWCTGIPDREDGPDFYTLALGSVLGMCLMASANHLLIVFLGIEMASVPSYALAGMLKGRRDSSEAALKFAVYGAGAAGIMLYGISLLAGAVGSAHIPTMAVRLAEMAESGTLGDYSTVLILGGLMMA